MKRLGPSLALHRLRALPIVHPFHVAVVLLELRERLSGVREGFEGSGRAVGGGFGSGRKGEGGVGEGVGWAVGHKQLRLSVRYRSIHP